MVKTLELKCDGCGQKASAEHTARRLERLEWATRYRPLHIHTLLLGAFAPREEKDFLYSPKGEFQGEAARVLEALGLSYVEKAPEAVQAEVQRAGLFLAHVLECPPEAEAGGAAEAASLLAERLPTVAARIRRSLKPRRVMPITKLLAPLVDTLRVLELGCPILLDQGRPFELDGTEVRSVMARLREALGVQAGT